MQIHELLPLPRYDLLRNLLFSVVRTLHSAQHNISIPLALCKNTVWLV